MITKFYVIKRKDGKYLRYNDSRYGRSWTCTDDILNAKKYYALNHSLFASDVQSYLDGHKSCSALDFTPMCVVATFKETKVYGGIKQEESV